MSNPTSADYTRGALCGLGAACIWSGWIVVARLGLRTSVTPWDIAALRFGVSGLLLLPYLWRKGLAMERLGWVGLAALVLGCGAPMVLLVNAGLLFAPAAHAGALFKGVLDCDLAAEISARTRYQEAARYCHTAQDYVTRDLFEKLMADEEHHIDFLETQLDLVSRLGLELYA